jgi:hypothetical protein
MHWRLLSTELTDDGRRGQIVADAHVDDDVVTQIALVGKQQARRGRRPKESH